MSALSQSLPNSFLAPSRALRHLRHYPTLLRPYHPPSPKPQQRRLFSLRHSIRARYASLPYTIRLPISTFLTLITWFPVLWFLHNKVFQLMLVNGPSMYPFLNTDHYTSKRRDIVAVKMWKAGYDVRRGDVVVFRSPLDPEKVVLKRVIAVEGDVVQTRVPYPVDKQEIAIGHVWVEGEHPEHSRWSYDSNSYGAISKNLIMGKVIGVVWPWSRRSWISSDQWPGNRRVIEKKPEDDEEPMAVAL